MLGKTKISDTRLIGPRCPCTHHPAFCQRISWPRRVQPVWPQWLYQPWPQLWIDPSSLTGPSVQSELYATSGGLFLLLMGLNLSLSSLPQSRFVKKGGGGEVSQFGPVYRSLLTDYGLKGFLTTRSNQAWMKIYSVCEFT